jgi:hypothetical protein
MEEFMYMLLDDLKTMVSYAVLGCLLVPLQIAAAEWKIEAVDAAGPGRFSSLRLDRDGNAHVSYVVDEHNQLRYGFWDHLQKKWFIMPVAINASFCSLALDSKQQPHISYADAGTMSGSRLRYAHWDGLKWNIEALPLDSDIVAYYTSIALDTADRPNISFYEYRGRRGSEFSIRLRVVSLTDGHWEVRTVDPSNGSGKYNSMAIDANDQLRLAYANVNAMTPGARMATWTGKEWRLEIVDDRTSNNGRTVGPSMAVTLDKNGTPHLAYRDMNAPLVKYATISGGRWATEVVDFPVMPPRFEDRNSIAINEAGHPYISYYDARRGELRLAHKEGARWQVEVVDTGSAGLTSSLQIDRDSIWISYADETKGQLKVARRTREEAAAETGDGKSAESSRRQPTRSER